jgi:zinc protease
VRTDVTAPAVAEIFNEIRRMADTQVTPEELNMARDSQVRSMPGNFETSASAAGSFANIYVYDLGLDYFAKLPGQLSGVTAEQVGTVAKKYLVADKFIVVAVGDRSKIEAELLKLNLGKEEIRDADGNIVK